jgi:II/X family phage/plasmid replication protein
MYDTITARLPVSCLADDAAWHCDRWVRGAHSSVLHVRRRGNTVVVSGSYARFCQGHNVWSGPDLRALCTQTLSRVAHGLGLPLGPEDWRAIREGHVPLTRVDVFAQYDVGSPERVQAWLEGAGARRRAGRQSVSTERSRHGATVYAGKRSRNVTLRLYGKGGELRQRGLPDGLEQGADLLAYAAPLLRVEVTLRKRVLIARGLDKVAAWADPTVARAIIDERVALLEIEDAMVVADDVLAGLPRHLRLAYHAWRAGEDLRATCCRATFYRYRKALLVYGVDIAHARPHVVHADTLYPLGAPARSFLAGPPVEVPLWAQGDSSFDEEVSDDDS